MANTNTIVLNETMCNVTLSGELSLRDTYLDYSFENTKIVIPENINDVDIEYLSPDFLANTKIKSVKLPQTLYAICENAFSNCNELKTINLPQNVSLIDNGAFANCEKLKTVNFDDYKYIEFENNAFYNTPWLEKKIENAKDMESVVLNNLLVYGGPSEEKLFISNDITVINDGVFENDDYIKSVVVPDTVIEIGNKAFSNCLNLEDIFISDSVENIGKETFYNNHFLDVHFSGSKESADDLFRKNIRNGKISSDAYSLICDNGKICYEYEHADKNIDQEMMRYIEAKDKNIVSVGSYIKKVFFDKDDNSQNIAIIPNKVNGIEINELGDCSIELPSGINTLYIPNTITKINKSAIISNDSHLLTIRFYGECRKDIDIDISNNAFDLCPSVKNIYFSKNMRIVLSKALDDIDEHGGIKLLDIDKEINKKIITNKTDNLINNNEPSL